MANFRSFDTNRRIVSVLYNKAPKFYTEKQRLEKACYLLQIGTMNIMEVANAVGYSNPSHFAEVFKEKYGLNPRDFVRYRSQ